MHRRIFTGSDMIFAILAVAIAAAWLSSGAL